MDTQNTFEVVSAVDAIVRRMGNEIDEITISLYKREAHLVAVNHERGDYSVHSYYWFDGEPMPSQLAYGHYDCNYETARAVLREKARHILGGAR